MTRAPATDDGFREEAPSPLAGLPGLAGLTWIGIFAVLASILIYGRSVLIPLAVAVLLWHLINALARLIGRSGMGHIAIPRWLCLTISILIMVIGCWQVVNLIAGNVAQVSGAAANYEANIRRLLPELLVSVGIEEPPTMAELMTRIDVGGLVARLSAALGALIGNVGLIALYVAFLLLEQGSFEMKVRALFPKPERAAHIRHVLADIERRIERYIWIKTLMSLLTAGLSYAVLWVMAVDYAEFWALIIFFFNYIPTVGSILAVALPALLTLVQFASISSFLAVVAPLAAIQFLVGNLLEPRLMGSQLNLSPLVVILSLSLWASIWGIAGMFLCVPIMVILLIILSQFNQTRPIAILMSSSGKVD